MSCSRPSAKMWRLMKTVSPAKTTFAYSWRKELEVGDEPVRQPEGRVFSESQPKA